MTAADLRVGVIGLGLMGSGIAEVCARAGFDVRAVDIDEDAVAAGLDRVRGSLARAVERGKLPVAESEAALARIAAGTEIGALGDRDLVIEAASEDEAIKVGLFRRLDGIVGPDAILASNTSAIPISRLAAATARPERVIGLHFFNPAPVMALVEVIAGLRTAESTRQRAEDFVRALGKTAVAAPDRAGFIVNALLVPYLLAGIRMLDTGRASADDIDTAMRLGCGHPMGPLELADLAGLDTVAAAAESLHREFGEPLYSPPPLLLRMVESGMLGRKSGRGFHSY
ncbi:MAG: 3-hydroxybutyryl-CoA dehydrogenase [Micrococcales bacterium 70-64]|nr:3-hydroxybutyryl-CoA dehydrogenase [Leifsonia sp.]ODU63494.1 MAG: 3-hydroxybutyryl-CoA dehydrogenase [Leifsonia sp. SCN 70-46]OJX85185.1 MAG: 3-hydroxybutyryl-CoA dehydrogenase [Micrococcales bacterium 70-64]